MRNIFRNVNHIQINHTHWEAPPKLNVLSFPWPLPESYPGLNLDVGASQVAQWVRNPPANAGGARDAGSVPGSGRSPGRGNGTPLQDSCLENPMDRGAWWAMVHEVAKSQTWLSTHTHTHIQNIWKLVGAIFKVLTGLIALIKMSVTQLRDKKRAQHNTVLWRKMILSHSYFAF